MSFINLQKYQKASKVYISERFQQVVILHILKNNLQKVEAEVPLLLGIHGPSGEGKTFQIEQILKKMGVKRFLLSGGQMESPIPGQPAHLVRTTYIQASENMRGGGCSLAVVLINDVDTGLGSVGEMGRYTINQQAVFGELMHLVDYPGAVEGRDTLRIPIIITGNDFRRLYAPLVRAGRMTAFEWIPTWEERVQIVCGIIPELSKAEIERLIMELRDELRLEMVDPAKALTVAFFSHLRSSLMDEDLWREVEQNYVDKVVDNILTGKEPDLTLGITYERVFAKGLELARSGELFGHLPSMNNLSKPT